MNNEIKLPSREPLRIAAKLSPTGKSATIPKCPFCRQQHWHGAMSGHRTAHCLKDITIEIDGIVYSNNRGYILEVSQ